MLFVLGGIVYWAGICIFRTKLIALLYAGQYTNIKHLLPWIGLASIFWGAAQGPALALRARKTPASVFVMYLVSAVVAVGVGVPATLRYGLAGAVAAMLLASAAAWITGMIRLAKAPAMAELQQAA